jgi:hypothetical protein
MHTAKSLSTVTVGFLVLAVVVGGCTMPVERTASPAHSETGRLPLCFAPKERLWIRIRREPGSDGSADAGVLGDTERDGG